MPSLSQLPDVYGPWAVVTGASSGMGASFCTYLASLGFSVVLIARRVDKMEALSASIQKDYPSVSVKVLGIDLTSDTAMGDIAAGVASLDIGLVVNNAGVDLGGNFLKFESGDHDRVIALNVTAYTRVAHMFGRLLASRTAAAAGGATQKRGGMLMISSMGSNPFPYCSSYSASKAYVTTLGLCLAEEWKPHNVDVTVIEPGAVRTEMFDRARDFMDVEAMGFTAMQSDEFVRHSMAAFAQGTRRFTPGVKNRVSQLVLSMIPEGARTAMVANMVAKGMGEERTTYKPEASS